MFICYSNTVLNRDRPYVTQNLLRYLIKIVTSNCSLMFKWNIRSDSSSDYMERAWKPSEPWVRQMLTICREIRTSIQGSGDGADSDIWADILSPNGKWQYLLSFFPPSSWPHLLIFCSRMWGLCMKWHWELVLTYEIQYQYIRQMLPFRWALSLSPPDLDWYDLINMQGHRERGHLFFISYHKHLYGSLNFPWYKEYKKLLKNKDASVN